MKKLPGLVINPEAYESFKKDFTIKRNYPLSVNLGSEIALIVDGKVVGTGVLTEAGSNIYTVGKYTDLKESMILSYRPIGLWAGLVEVSTPNDEPEKLSEAAWPGGSDEGEWDGPKEVAAADVEDLKVMCAIVTGDPEVKGSYKLPHHRAADKHPVVYRGCSAALAALSGARGGVKANAEKKAAARAHLMNHMRNDFPKHMAKAKETFIYEVFSNWLDEDIETGDEQV